MSTSVTRRRVSATSRKRAVQIAVKSPTAAVPAINTACPIHAGNTIRRVWNGKTYNTKKRDTGKQPYYPSPPPQRLPVDAGETTLLRYIETIHDSQARK